MDSCQDQMQYDLVPKLYSNPAHSFPVVSGYSAIQYFGNFLAGIFLSMMDSKKESSVNSHWAALSQFAFCMKINKCISSTSPVVQLFEWSPLSQMRVIVESFLCFTKLVSKERIIAKLFQRQSWTPVCPQVTFRLWLLFFLVSMVLTVYIELNNAHKEILSSFRWS